MSELLQWIYRNTGQVLIHLIFHLFYIFFHFYSRLQFVSGTILF